MLRITNCSAEPMPAGMGLHPFFPVTDGVYIEAALTSIWQVDDAILPVGLVDLPAQVHKIEVAKTPLDNVFGGWSRSARIVWPQQGASLEITAQEPLNFLVLYTPQGEPYFCAEPVSNATDAFNLAADGSAETGMMLLAAGETQSAVIRFVPSLNAASDRH